MKCKTCDEINFWKNYHKIPPGFTDKLFAKISIYTWKKGDKKIKGKQKSTITSQAYDLKYCPTCGIKLGSDEE